MGHHINHQVTISNNSSPTQFFLAPPNLLSTTLCSILFLPNPLCIIARRPRHHATLVLSPLLPLLPSSLAFSIYFLWQQKQLRSPLSHSAAVAEAEAAGRSSSAALSLSAVTASTPKRVAAAAAFGHITLSSRYIWRRRLWLHQGRRSGNSLARRLREFTSGIISLEIDATSKEIMVGDAKRTLRMAPFF